MRIIAVSLRLLIIPIYREAVAALFWIKQGQVVGVLFAGVRNVLSAIKINHLKELIAGNIGTKCPTSTIIDEAKNCIKEEIQKLIDLAERVSVYVQFELALMYYNGEGVEQNFQEALHWYERAAKLGHVEAQYKLARIYYKSKGTPKGFRYSLPMV